jgi:hypothetical protein
MVEVRLRETSDIGVSALVLGVTRPALPLGCERMSGMKTNIRCDIGRHFLVTIETQRRLRFDIERAMARRTVFFILSVFIRKRTRHDQLLPINCERVAGERNDQHRHSNPRTEAKGAHARTGDRARVT